MQLRIIIINLILNKKRLEYHWVTFFGLIIFVIYVHNGPSIFMLGCFHAIRTFYAIHTVVNLLMIYKLSFRIMIVHWISKKT